jgi:TP901 family phage tail tape measure protein
MRAQSAERLQIARRELAQTRALAEQRIAAAESVAADPILARQAFRGSGGQFQSTAAAMADARAAADATRQIEAANVRRATSNLETTRIEAATAGRVASIRQTIFRTISTQEARTLLSQRNYARERVALAQAEEARLLEVYARGQAAIRAMFGRANARDVAAGRATQVGQILSVQDAYTKANRAVAAARADIKRYEQAATQSITPLSGLWTKQKNLIAQNASQARALGYSMLTTGAVMGAVFVGAIVHAAKLEREIRNVMSITPRAQQNYPLFLKQILDISKQLPQSQVELAKGFYEIASAGKFGADGLKILRVSAIAASAGLTTTENASKAVIASLNAYGYSAAKAGYVSDVLFQTVRVGIVTFEELTQQLGDFIAFGAIAGIPLEHLGIAMSTITRAGVPAAEASTSLNRVIQAFIKPSKDMQAELGRLGLAQGAEALTTKLTADQADRYNEILKRSGREGPAFMKGQTLGLIGVMELLGASTQGNVTQIQHLFREIRAARGAYAIMSASGHTLNQVLHDWNEEGGVAGRTFKALQEQQKGLAYQWGVTKNVISAAGTEMAQSFLPIARGVLQGLQGIGKTFTALPHFVKTGIEGFGLFATTVVLFLGLTNVFGPRVLAMGRALQFLGVSAEASSRAMKVAGITANLLAAALTIGTIVFMRHAEAAAKAAASLDAHRAALEQERDGIAGVTEAYYAQRLEQTGAIKAMNDLGIASGTATDAIEGSAKAQRDLYTFATSMRTHSGKWFMQDGSVLAKELTQALQGSGKASRQLKTDMQNVDLGGLSRSDIRRWHELTLVIRQVTGLTAERRAVIAAVTRADKEQAEAQSNVNKQIGLTSINENGLASALDKTKQKTIELTDAQKGLQQAFTEFLDPKAMYTDILNGMKPLTSAVGVYTDAMSAEQSKLKDQAAASAKAYNRSLADQTYAARVAARDQKQSINESLATYGKVPASVRAAATAEKNAATDRAAAIAHANSQAKKSAKDFAQVAQVSIDEYLKALDDAVVKQADYQKNIDTLFERAVKLHIDTGFIEEIRQAGKDGVQLAAELANGTNTQLSHFANDYKKLKPDVAKSFTELLTEMRQKSEDFISFQSNLEKLAGMGYGKLAEEIGGMGAQAGSSLAAGAVKATKDQLSEMDALWENALAYSGQGGNALVVQFEKQLNLMATLSATAPDKINLKTIADQLQLQGGANEIIQFFAMYKDKIDKLPKDVALRIHAVVAAQDVVDQTGKKKADLQAGLQKELDKIKTLHLPAVIKRELEDEARASVAKGMGNLQAKYDEAKKLLETYSSGNPIGVTLDPKGNPLDVDKALDLGRTRTVKVRAQSDNSRPDGGKTPAGWHWDFMTQSWQPDDPRHPRGPNPNNQANGAILHFFAKGAENHVAQVAPAGAWRVWAEPETGGEAYIPLAANKRARSLNILDTVADRFGYRLMKFADGGLSGRPVGSAFGIAGSAPVIVVRTDGSQTHSTTNDFRGMTIQAQDMDAAMAQIDRRRRRANLAGGVVVARA